MFPSIFYQVSLLLMVPASYNEGDYSNEIFEVPLGYELSISALSFYNASSRRILPTCAIQDIALTVLFITYSWYEDE